MRENNFSREHIEYLKSRRMRNIKIKIFQIVILFLSLVVWEHASKFNLVDSFLISSPSRILMTLVDLNSRNQLWNNVFITVFETTLGFTLGTLIGLALAVIIWWSDMIFRIIEPYLIVLNAIPKVAFGPIIIVWIGSGISAVVAMALLVSVIISTINILSGFQGIDKNKVFLMKSFGATKFQILTKLVFPANIGNIISTLKINVGMSLIGVITGEFLVASCGIGYLIVYGGQVFKMDLVMAGILILAVIATLLYIGVSWIEFLYTRNQK